MPLSRTARLDRLARGVCVTHPDRDAVPGRPWCAACIEGLRAGKERWRRKQQGQGVGSRESGVGTDQPHSPLPTRHSPLALEPLRADLEAVWAHLRAHEQLVAEQILANAARRGLPETQARLLGALVEKGRGRTAEQAHGKEETRGH
jgi:hypothetical protein